MFRSIAVATSLALAATALSQPLTTAFTFQGELDNGGTPVSGVYDLKFTLFDAPTGGNQLGTQLCSNNVAVTNGKVTVQLDFGSQFAGQQRFLEVWVRQDTGLDCASNTGFSILGPRQSLTATPNAVYAMNAAGATQLNGQPASFYTNAANLTGTLDPARLPPTLNLTSSTSPVFGVTDSSASGSSIGINAQTSSTGGTAISAAANSTSGGNCGVSGTSYSSSGFGIRGIAASLTGVSYGLYGQANSTIGIGVGGYGTSSSGGNYGVFGQSNSTAGCGVYGYASSTSGNNNGVYGQTNSNGGTAVRGVATNTSGTVYGVYGQTSSSNGYGVVGNNLSSNGVGVFGESNGGVGVYGNSNIGGEFYGSTYGVYGTTSLPGAIAVYGSSTNSSGGTFGGYFNSGSSSGQGAHCVDTAGSGTTYGVVGEVLSGSGYGVYSLGTFAATGAKAFRIDHPADPENKYLMHYCAEGPDALNVYTGKVTLDEQGAATIDMPGYFASINKDPRYLLTPIGAAMPMLHVALEIDEGALAVGNAVEPGQPIPHVAFRVEGGSPGAKVSWEVKALRSDRWFQQHEMPVEADKPEGEKGKYQHPELYGQPREKGVSYRSPDKLPAERSLPSPDRAE